MKSRLKDWLEFARFAVKHPGIIGHMNYKVDENVDRLLNTLIEDKDRVTLISRDSYTIDLKYKGYTIPLANQYLVRLSLSRKLPDGKTSPPDQNLGKQAAVAHDDDALFQGI